MLPTLAPMLATGGPLPTSGDLWAFEPKLDGWRVLVYVDDDVEVRTRTGRSIAASVPELSPLPEALAARRVVLDGEPVAGQGRPEDFYRLAPRLTAQRACGRGPVVPIRSLDVRSVRSLVAGWCGPHRGAVRSPTDGAGEPPVSGRSWCTAASYDDGVDLLRACADLDLEGARRQAPDVPVSTRRKS